MKKVISLMLALVLALSLTACGGKTGPEGVVGQFCKGLQELDEKAIAQCFENGDDLELSELEDVDSDDAVAQKIMDFMKSCAGRLKYQVGEATVVLGGKAQELLTGKGVGERKVTVGIRPEHIAFAAAPGTDTVSSKVDVSEMMGSEMHLHMTVSGHDVIAVIPTAGLSLDDVRAGGTAHFTFDPELMHLFDPKTEENLFPVENSKAKV